MKIIGIVGSPHKNSNTALLVSKVLETVDGLGAKTEIIWLRELNISYCTGCRQCHKTGKCRQDDDLLKLQDKMLEADGLIWGSPTQMTNVSGNMKVFIDRCNLFFHNQSLSEKYGIAVSVGADYGYKKVAQYLESTLWSCGAYTIGNVFGKAGAHGEILKDERAIRKARELGKQLVKVIDKRIEYRWQKWKRKLFILSSIKKDITEDKDRYQAVYEHWEEKGWIKD